MSTSAASQDSGGSAAAKSGVRAKRALHFLSFGNIGAVYVWAVIIVIFSIWVPDTFPTIETVKQVLNGNAVTALIALSLVIPLSARVFDLSVAFTATLGGVSAAYFVAHGMEVPIAVLLALLISLAVGVVNGTVVVLLGVDSFIGTLATGSIIQAVISLITGDLAITDPRLAQGFSDIAQKSIGSITLPVFYVLILAIVLAFVLDHTATGRRIYATGFNGDGAKLAGVRINRLRFASLLVSAVISGAAGIVLMSTISAGDPNAGSPYLLPAYAAAFLGATQLRGGKFNPWGTIIAILLLGTGTVGLGLASAPTWSAELFQGVVLIAALAVTGYQRRGAGSESWRRRIRRKGGAVATD